MDLTPRQIVAELDKYIVGQKEAKRAVAIALRNRIRRRKLPKKLQEEIMPKNILMIGPTGVGKTEIARRLARLVGAPFVKVEATKFTEVGYVGRDVEAMVRDLVETAIRMVKAERMAKVQDRARELAEERIISLILRPRRKPDTRNPFEVLFGAQRDASPAEEEEPEDDTLRGRREELRRRLKRGELDHQIVEIEVEDKNTPMVEVFSAAGVEEMGINLQDLLGGMFPPKKKRKRVPVKEALPILVSQEAQRLIDMDQVVSEALERTEQSGIIFIDEIDKIAGSEGRSGPDVSREGVQRDILPIVEGTTVVTKHGPVRTDHILFIAAGAFHVAKPSDLIPELQGRFPIRVELEALKKEDFVRILREPENALTRQYAALLETEGVKVVFTDDGIEELAAVAYTVNERTENIGARRLHTVMEKLLEDISFHAPDMTGVEVTIDASYVRQKLADVVGDEDLSRYIL